MRKGIAGILTFLLCVTITPSQAAIKAATVANVGDQCLRDGKIAPGRAVDGSDLTCMKSTSGSSKGQLLWWYPKLSSLKILEVIAPIISRSSDAPEVIASRSADKIGKLVGNSFKLEELSKDFSSKNFTGGSGSLALTTFQAYRNRSATSFIGSQTLVNGLITSKSQLKLSDSKAIAQLVAEYEGIAVSSNSKYQSIDQLMSELKNNPKSVTFIGGALGGVDHLFVAKLFNSLNLDPKQINFSPQSSPYEISSKVQSDKSFVGVSGSGDFTVAVNSGKLRLLGIAAPEKQPWTKARTLQQQGIDLVYGNWYGIFVPQQLSDTDTANFVRLIDVLVHTGTWAKALSDNYLSDAYLGQRDFISKLENQTSEAKTILQELGL